MPMTNPVSKIKSRIEQAQAKENWNDFDWLCDSLIVAVEAMDKLVLPPGVSCSLEELLCSGVAERALSKISHGHLESGAGQ